MIPEPPNWAEFRRFVIMNFPAEIAYTKLEEMASHILEAALSEWMKEN